MQKLVCFLVDDTGTTAIEYGLIAGLISIALVAGLSAFGSQTTLMYDYINTRVLSAIVN